jgi:MHS family proline/betaine transporter-like MFS transporter
VNGVEAQKHPLKVLIGGAFGNALEWYDFALFGFFAPVIGRLFFPETDRLATLLQAFGVFALGYLARPLGGILFGHLGDRLGRKLALQLSVALMAIPTALVGVLPGHASIGMWAPIGLTVIRLFQGVSVGGELIGSYSFLGEQAAVGRRGFMCSWASFSAVAGILIGSAVAALLSAVLTDEQLIDWGWRIPFLLGIAVGVAGLWLRRQVPESAVFEQACQAQHIARLPLLEALEHNWRSILATIAMSLPASVGFYIPFVWLSAYLDHVRQPPITNALTANTVALAVLMVLCPVAGALSDRLGRKLVFVGGTATTALVAYPLFVLLGYGGFEAVLVAQVILAVCASLASGSYPALLVELFPTTTRYSGVALGYNLTQALLGGTAPLVATWLVEMTGSLVAPALYLVACLILACLVCLATKERSRAALE